MIQIGNVKVVDFHVHFLAHRPGTGRPELPPLLQAYARERDARMSAEWDHEDQPEPAATTEPEETALADRWANEAEHYRLERICFVTGSGIPALGQVVARHPQRLAGLAFLRNPLQEGSLDELRRGIEECGLRGLKLLGPLIDASMDDERLMPIWAYLARHELPCLIHFGPLGKAGGWVAARNMSPLTLEPVCRRYPEIPFVVPHFGCGYMQDLLWLMWSFPRVYVDTSGSNQWMRWVPYPMDIEIALRKFYETVGPERIIFGTDSSWFPRGFSYRYLQDQVRACRYLNLSEPELELIFSRNALRLLKLEPNAT